MSAALVTGGSRGIGRAIAVELARAGHEVTLTFNSSTSKAEDTARQIREAGGRARIARLTLDDPRAIRGQMDAILETNGPYDVLVNSAGGHNRAPFLEMTLEQWQSVIDLDLTAPALVAQSFARGLVAKGKPGSIVNIGSINGLIAYPNLAHYCSAKGGVHMFTRALALELARHSIRVNAIAPGLIDTDLTRAIFQNEDLLQGKLERIPLGRHGRADEVASLVRYLVSPEAQWMTGSIVTLDGGQHIH
ncbi:MAG: SDR family NAD(P)-dependent oxidoreductase [Roseiarcus sp.]|jgi:NAD(P)-dependent dehydrogenase (short-subunit alcohol dehydrogenase family)